MRRALFILSLAVLVLLGAAAGGVYAFDQSRRDVIADGVVAGGVNVGGLTTAEAYAVLRHDLRERFFRPVTLRHGDERFVLTAKAADVRLDIGSMLREAIARSREGNPLTRTWRDATDDRLDVRIPVRVAFSRRAVDSLVERVRKRLYVAPKSADVEISLTSILEVPSRDGRAVVAPKLRRAIHFALLDARQPRVIPIPTRAVEPETTTAELAKKYSHVITVSRSEKRLRLFERLRLVKTYTIAVGQVAYATPAGLYKIQNKAVNPAWHVPRSAWAGSLAGRIIPPGPDNPIKARWMGFYNGAGIHGTDAISSLGRAASHGCVRMSIPDVIELYDRVPVGAPLYIA